MVESIGMANKKISIKQFGPIREGTEGKFIDIRKCTVFIGPQGSGKSSVAKLISQFSWLEKALVRRELDEEELMTTNRFKDYYCAYHRISDFFRAETEIGYEGEYYKFQFKQNQFQVQRKVAELYTLPKIMYIPAERNFVSVIERADLMKSLPASLFTFLEEFDLARQHVKAELDLPVGNVRFSYDKLKKVSWVSGDNYRIPLREAASGYQSLIPLYLVSWQLASFIQDKEKMRPTDLNLDTFHKLQQEVDTILNNRDLSQEVKTAALRNLSSRFSYSYFINIVEEPEQNLYPVSQKDILYALVAFANQSPASQLLLTTHSPYILAALNNLIYAEEVSRKYPAEVEALVPASYRLAVHNVAAYATDGGRITSIIDPELNQIKAEMIDGVSDLINQLYDQLLTIDLQHDNIQGEVH